MANMLCKDHLGGLTLIALIKSAGRDLSSRMEEYLKSGTICLFEVSSEDGEDLADMQVLAGMSHFSRLCRFVLKHARSFLDLLSTSEESAKNGLICYCQVRFLYVEEGDDAQVVDGSNFSFEWILILWFMLAGSF